MTAKSITPYPAIDLKDGSCVRLLHGRMDKATIYNENPADQAKAFREAGFDWIHIVDLDGAFAGSARNAAAIESIASLGGHTQLGGGIRNMDAVDHWLNAGISRVILGTAAVRDPEFVKMAGRTHPGRIIIGIDARDGRVRTDGWDGITDASPLDVARRFEDCGMAGIIFTDIARDGALGGVNVEATAALAKAVNIPVIASGGVASKTDIEALVKAPAPIEGVIIGRALYTGALSPAEAIAAAGQNR